MSGFTFKAWQVLVMCSLAALLTAMLSMLYANKVAHESERKWCGIVATLDSVYRSKPPETPAGAKMASEIAKLRDEFGCPRKDLAQ